MLKYTEEHNNLPVFFNGGTEALYWQFKYEPFNIP